MKDDHIKNYVRAQMPDKRWQHTLGVIETAVKLANKYGADANKAHLAALLHDLAKYWPADKLREIIIEQQLYPDMLEYDVQLLHSHVGAFVAEAELAIKDEEVLDAVRFHTSGRDNMTILDKIVCLADYIEPGRVFPGVDHIRDLSEKSLEEALVAGLDSTISFLISKGKKIYPLTVLARNSLIDELRRHAS